MNSLISNFQPPECEIISSYGRSTQCAVLRYGSHGKPIYTHVHCLHFHAALGTLSPSQGGSLREPTLTFSTQELLQGLWSSLLICQEWRKLAFQVHNLKTDAGVAAMA